MLPQLDVATYSSQIFWLIICLCSLYLSMKFIFIPRLLRAMDNRNLHIQKLMEEAAYMQVEADEINQKYKDEMKELNLEAQKIRNTTISLFEKKMNEEVDKLNKHHTKELGKFYMELAEHREQVAAMISDESQNITKILTEKIEKEK